MTTETTARSPSARRSPLSILLLTAISLVMGMGVTWYMVAATAVGLSSFGAPAVMYTLMASMLLLPVAGAIFSRITAKWSIRRTVTVTYLAVIGQLLLLWAATALSGWGVVPLGLVLFIKFFSTFTYVPFWQLVTKAFPGEEGCRPTLVVTAGFPIAQIVAGASASLWLAHVAAEQMILIAAGGTLFCCVLLAVWLARYGEPTEDSRPEAQPTTRRGASVSSSFLATVFFTAALVAVAAALVAHVFRATAAIALPEQVELTRCLAFVEALTGGVELVVLFGVSGRLIRRMGVVPGLLGLPLLLTAVAVAMLCGSAFSLGGVLWIAAAAKIIESVVRPALHKPSLKLLIDLLPFDRRTRLVAWLETIVTPLATVAAGGMVLLLSTALGLSPAWCVAALVVVCLIWIPAAWALTSGYRSILAARAGDPAVSAYSVLPGGAWAWRQAAASLGVGVLTGLYAALLARTGGRRPSRLRLPDAAVQWGLSVDGSRA